MWRNWLGGSRDMYYAVSADEKVFRVKKLGEGTWPLNACPMDGGGLALDGAGGVHSVWRRDGAVFMTAPGKKEVELGKGKNVALAMAKAGPVVAWQNGPSILVKKPESTSPAAVGTGAFPALASSGDSVYVAWEQEGSIAVERVQ
jgi:hypothetical protein